MTDTRKPLTENDFTDDGEIQTADVGNKKIVISYYEDAEKPDDTCCGNGLCFDSFLLCSYTGKYLYDTIQAIITHWTASAIAEKEVFVNVRKWIEKEYEKDSFDESFGVFYDDLYHDDILDKKLEELLQLFSQAIPIITGETTGHSQGQFASYARIATPKGVMTSHLGEDKTIDEVLEFLSVKDNFDLVMLNITGEQKEYNAWLWNDVFSFKVYTMPEDDDIDTSDINECEEIHEGNCIYGIENTLYEINVFMKNNA